MTMAILVKENIELRVAAYSFRGSLHYHHGGEHDNTQADVVLELRVLHLAGNRKSTDKLGGILSIGNHKAHSHVFQQGGAHSNKAIPSNSATPYEIMGANYIQTATYM